MKRSITEKLKFLIPLLLITIGIGFIFLFEFYIKDKVNTVQVVVANKDIPFKAEITANDLSILNVNRDFEIDGGFKPNEVSQIIGKYASIEIKKGTQLYPELIDTYNLVPDESKGEFIAPIPKEWLYAVPGTLKRSYVADIYVVPSEEQILLDQLLNGTSTNSKTQEQNQILQNETTQNNLENNESENVKESTGQSDIFIKEMYKPILTGIRVAFVRDSSNSEVTTDESNDPNSATNSIASVEIIANDEILQTIREKVDRGYKLYVVYNYERSKRLEQEGEKTDETNSNSK